MTLFNTCLSCMNPSLRGLGRLRSVPGLPSLMIHSMVEMLHSVDFFVFLSCMLVHSLPIVNDVLLQLDGIKVEGEGGSMNVSAVAMAAVDIAASVVDAALLNVQRTVAKSMEQPEVCSGQ